MHVSLIEYQLTGIDQRRWATVCADLAPQFTRVSGLHSKIWLTGAGGGLGGLYVWSTERSYEAFLASELGSQLGAHPNVARLTTRHWSVDEAPTAITRGGLEQ